MVTNDLPPSRKNGLSSQTLHAAPWFSCLQRAPISVKGGMFTCPPYQGKHTRSMLFFQDEVSGRKGVRYPATLRPAVSGFWLLLPLQPLQALGQNMGKITM